MSMHKQYKPEILNPGFSTIMLFRCSPRKYADEFVRGEIYWSTPQIWIDKEKEGKTEQGDILEGTFASVIPLVNHALFERLKSSSDVSFFTNNGFTFFRRDYVLNLPSLCLYGLHNSSFKQIEGENGLVKRIAIIPKDYFLGFAGCKNKEEYDELSDKEKAVVILIKDTREFFERVKKAFIKLGVCENDIIISPVNYYNKYQENVFLGNTPYELLNKDLKYKTQSEVRIIINCKNTKLLDALNIHNNHINIGSIEDITEIYNYYFDDMQIELRGNNSIMFSLPEPDERDINTFNFIELYVLLLHVVAYKTVEIIGNSEDKSDTDLNIRIKTILDMFQKKFNVIAQIDNNNNIALYNLSKEFQDQFDDYHRKDIVAGKFVRKLESILNNNGPIAVIDECNKHCDDEVLSIVSYYFLGLSNKLLGRFEEAIDFYSKAYRSNYMPVESLDGIAGILYRNKQYNDAISVYKKMLFYECNSYDVWTNIGICYIENNKLDEAIVSFDKSISLNPYRSVPYYNQGLAYLRKGNMTKAKELMHKSIVIDPDNSVYKQVYINTFGSDDINNSEEKNI